MEKNPEFMRSQSRQSKNIYDPFLRPTPWLLIRHKTRNVSMEYQDSFSMIETEDQKPKKIRYSSRKALIQIKKQ